MKGCRNDASARKDDYETMGLDGGRIVLRDTAGADGAGDPAGLRAGSGRGPGGGDLRVWRLLAVAGGDGAGAVCAFGGAGAVREPAADYARGFVADSAGGRIDGGRAGVRRGVLRFGNDFYRARDRVVVVE